MVNSICSWKSHRNVLSLGEAWSSIRLIGADSIIDREKITDRKAIKEPKGHHIGEYGFSKFERKKSG